MNLLDSFEFFCLFSETCLFYGFYECQKCNRVTYKSKNRFDESTITSSSSSYRFL